MRRTVILVLASVLYLLAVTALQRPPWLTRAQDTIPAKPNVHAAVKLLGVASCSASVCHGGADLGKPLSEATTWRALDPHARAYDTLLSPASQAIARHLWRGKKAAHQAPLCFKCHVHPEYDQARPNFRIADGVGCESCHGAAQDWLAPHYRGDRRGMADTRSLHGRAAICARCHVGTPDANFDHDLIAAGHPALRFEFATYFANLPPHWDVARDRRANSAEDDRDASLFEMKAWTVGQLASAAAALELRAHRADPAHGKPWPELAEFACFGCHRNLQGASRPPGRDSLSDGKLRMSDWYTAMPSLTPLHPLPRKESRSRVDIAKHAKDSAVELRAAARTARGSADTIKNLNAALSRLYPDGQPTGDWDVDTQAYLALLAISAAERQRSLSPLAKTLRDAVVFPPDFKSPKTPYSEK